MADVVGKILGIAPETTDTSLGQPVDSRSFTCRGAMGPLHAGHPDSGDLDALRQFVASINQ